MNEENQEVVIIGKAVIQHVVLLGDKYLDSTLVVDDITVLTFDDTTEEA